MPEAWVAPMGASGAQYLPINMVLEQINTPFIDALHRSFSEGFTHLMQYDQYSMWDYLTTVFTLGDLEAYYSPVLGAKTDLLPWPVASYLETTNVGSGMYGVSFIEMVIAVYDWGGGVDPYRPADHGVYMLTVDQGMQRFLDACRAVLDLPTGVTVADGQLAQVQVGMIPPGPGQPYSYTAPNLTPDAPPKPPETAAAAAAPEAAGPPPVKRRVFLQHDVSQLRYDSSFYDGHGGIEVTEADASAGSSDGPDQTRTYPYFITTLPNGAYLNGNLLDGLSQPPGHGDPRMRLRAGLQGLPDLQDPVLDEGRRAADRRLWRGRRRQPESADHLSVLRV